VPFLFERRFCPTSGMFHDFAMFCSDFSVWKNSRRAFRIGDISRPKATCFSGLGCIVLSQHMFFWHHRHCLVKEIRLPRKWHRFVPIWEKAYTFDSRKISSRYTGEIPLQYVFFSPPGHHFPTGMHSQSTVTQCFAKKRLEISRKHGPILRE